MSQWQTIQVPKEVSHITEVAYINRKNKPDVLEITLENGRGVRYRDDDVTADNLANVFHFLQHWLSYANQSGVSEMYEDVLLKIWAHLGNYYDQQQRSDFGDTDYSK